MKSEQTSPVTAGALLLPVFTVAIVQSKGEFLDECMKTLLQK